MYETLWEFRTREFRIALECAAEPYPDSSWWDDETRENIESGAWGVYTFKAAVYHHGREVGADHLGDSVYADPSEFRDHRACGRANREHAAAGHTGRCGSHFTRHASRSHPRGPARVECATPLRPHHRDCRSGA